MSLMRQGRRFALVGAVQWLVDCGAMFVLSHSGMPVPYANVAGRICGALLGFWLNGRFTFTDGGRRAGWRQLARYLLLWGANTFLSTAGVSAFDAAFGLRGAWLAKPLVDGALALGSFLVSRRWVYR